MTGIDAMERVFDPTKYGAFADSSSIEATIPSLADPSLVDGAAEGTHVLSPIVQWVPTTPRDGTWDDHREALGDAVIRTLETVAPGSRRARRSPPGPDPARPRARLRPDRRASAPRGAGPRLVLRLAAAAGPRPLPDAAAGLYLAGSGAHPGGGVTGVPGRNAAREVLADLKRRR